ncbi:MAG: hypothetical protein GF307_03090 [candidate division Zixibacteria bacterium]|nr:hypothetical protein [candidate division Zixibacteria bacterium]
MGSDLDQIQFQSVARKELSKAIFITDVEGNILNAKAVSGSFLGKTEDDLKADGNIAGLLGIDINDESLTGARNGKPVSLMLYDNRTGNTKKCTIEIIPAKAGIDLLVVICSEVSMSINNRLRDDGYIDNGYESIGNRVGRIPEGVSDYEWNSESGDLFSKLTLRELQIARMISEGKSSKEIASELDLSAGTVVLRRNHIRKKLGLVHTKRNLAVFLKKVFSREFDFGKEPRF